MKISAGGDFSGGGGLGDGFVAGGWGGGSGEEAGHLPVIEPNRSILSGNGEGALVRANGDGVEVSCRWEAGEDRAAGEVPESGDPVVAGGKQAGSIGREDALGDGCGMRQGAEQRAGFDVPALHFPIGAGAGHVAAGGIEVGGDHFFRMLKQVELPSSFPLPKDGGFVRAAREDPLIVRRELGVIDGFRMGEFLEHGTAGCIPEDGLVVVAGGDDEVAFRGIGGLVEVGIGVEQAVSQMEEHAPGGDIPNAGGVVAMGGDESSASGMDGQVRGELAERNLSQQLSGGGVP